MKVSKKWNKYAYEQLKEVQSENPIRDGITIDSRLDFKADYTPCEHGLSFNKTCLVCGEKVR